MFNTYTLVVGPIGVDWTSAAPGVATPAPAFARTGTALNGTYGQVVVATRKKPWYSSIENWFITWP